MIVPKLINNNYIIIIIIIFVQVDFFILLEDMMATHTLAQWNATTVTPNNGVMWHRCTTVEAALPQRCVMDIFMLLEAMGHPTSELLNGMTLPLIHGK